ncbi:MAG: hypothetical protein J0H41_03340 [Rhizobiales bacterium]|nr:hypothetical protein [Hyphomicrobiales bacterium]
MTFPALARRLLAAAGALVWLASPSHGQTALEMSVGCRLIAYAPQNASGVVNAPLTFETGRCWGGFLALQQASLYRDERNRPSMNLCLPPESTLTQLVRIFVRYTDSHPEEIGENWFRIAHKSMASAFPCAPAAKPGDGG